MGGASSSDSYGTCAANQTVLPCIDDPTSSFSSIISNDHVETMLPTGSVQSGGSTLQKSPVRSGSANGTCSSLDKARASQ